MSDAIEKPKMSEEEITSKIKSLTTKGETNKSGYGKDFKITTADGDEYYCLKMNKSGSRWVVEDQDFSTIKSIKRAIVTGELEPPTLEESIESGEVSHLDLIEPMNHDLDCLDAHTLLALIVRETVLNLDKFLYDEARRTLSNNGYFTEDDSDICWETVNRDLDGFRHRQALRGKVEVANGC